MEATCTECGWVEEVETAPNTCPRCGRENDDWMLFYYTAKSNPDDQQDPERRHSRSNPRSKPGWSPGQVIPVEVCPDADEAHRTSSRAYAHTFCKKAPTICVASAFFDLPPEHRDGILAHEIGHLLAGNAGDESDADAAFFEFAGVRIYYADGEWGQCLQALTTDDSRALLGKFDFDFRGQRTGVETEEEDAVIVYRVSGPEIIEVQSMNEALDLLDRVRSAGHEARAIAVEVARSGEERELAWRA